MPFDAQRSTRRGQWAPARWRRWCCCLLAGVALVAPSAQSKPVADKHSAAKPPVTLLIFTDYPPFLYAETAPINSALTPPTQADPPTTPVSQFSDGAPPASAAGPSATPTARLLKGLYLDIVRLTFEAMGEPYTLVEVPLKRGLRMAADGEGLVVGILKTNKRLRKLQFSEPFYRERTVIFTRASDGRRPVSVADLTGMQVGTLLGWSYGKDFDEARAAKHFSATNIDLSAGLRMLSAGRLDAVVHTELSGLYLLRQLKLQDKVRVADKAFYFGDVYLAGKRGAHSPLLNRFSQQLQQPDHQARLAALVHQYRNDPKPNLVIE